jgi:hypothetical protein
MNTANSNNAINPVDMITKLAETQITEAIVTAAKSKKTVEKTFSEEILENLAAGRYAEEAAINLTRIFGREFDPIADQILEFAKRLTPSDAPVAPAKKPRAKKVSKTLAPSAVDGNIVNEGFTETTNETKKTKKPRAKKVTVEPVVEPTNSNDVIAPVDAVVSCEPVEKPVPAAAKKPRAKKTVSIDTPNEKKEEPVAIASDSSVNVSEVPIEKLVAPAAKKPRAKKTVSVGTTSEKEEIVAVASDESVTVSEVPVEKSVVDAPASAAPPTDAPAKKPRAKKTVSVDTTSKKEEPVAAAAATDDSSVNAVSEKPLKKPRTKKVTVVDADVTVSPPATVSETFKPITEVQNEVAAEEVITSSAEHNDIILTDEDFDAELSGFSEGWTDELIEEELSDIEYDDE